MTAILRLESAKHLRGAVALTGAFALLAVFLLSVFPSLADEAELLEEAYPELMVVMFGFEAIHTLEGFLASYVYTLLWEVFVGIYFAYLGAGTIARDVRERRMDLTLSNPVSRESVVLQKVAALWVPLVVLSVGLFAVLYAGSVVLDETIDPLVLTMVHALSTPYLLVCAGIGVVLSVALDRPESAQTGAIGAVFLLWLVDGLAEMNEDLEWVGALTPSRYFDPTAIFVHEEYALVDATILLVTFLALLAVATIAFVRRDI